MMSSSTIITIMTMTATTEATIAMATMKPLSRNQKRTKRGSGQSLSPRKAGDPIPAAVYQAAVEFSKGKGINDLKVISPDPFGGTADTDSTVRTFLTTLLEQGGDAALGTLENALKHKPLALAHPVVWSMIQRWYLFRTGYEGFMFSNPELEEWCCKLVAAWAEGITVGLLTVSRRKEGKLPKSGRPPALFPALKEKHGWMQTSAALEATWKALGFMNAYFSLHHRLGEAVQWRVESANYRLLPEGTIRRVAPAVEHAFGDFKQQWGYSSRDIGVIEYDQMVREGFIDISKGHGGRHHVTCYLLSTLDHLQALQPNVKVTPSLIEETYATLRKHYSDGGVALTDKELEARMKNHKSTLREVKPRVVPTMSRSPKHTSKNRR
jgi:hypothetical protein